MPDLLRPRLPVTSLPARFFARLDRLLGTPEQLALRPTTLLRRRALTYLLLMHLVFVCSGVAWLLGYVIPLEPQSRQEGVATVILLGLYNLLLLLLVRRSHYQTVFANLFLLGQFLLAHGGILLSGGITASPIRYLALVIPLLAFPVAGRAWGLAWSALTLLIIAIQIAWPPAPLRTFDPHTTAQLEIAIYFLIFAVLTVTTLLYELLNHALSEQLRRERRALIDEASQDSLTRLANRRHFEARLAELVRNGTPFALAYLDLDRFKAINDAYGHATGDAVLQATADRIRESLRPTDLGARLGGDEFAMLITNIHDDSQRQSIHERLAAHLNGSMRVAEHVFPLECSIGIALYPSDGHDPASLLAMADRAMYEEKARHRARQPQTHP